MRVIPEDLAVRLGLMIAAGKITMSEAERIADDASTWCRSAPLVTGPAGRTEPDPATQRALDAARDAEDRVLNPSSRGN